MIQSKDHSETKGKGRDAKIKLEGNIGLRSENPFMLKNCTMQNGNGQIYTIAQIFEMFRCNTHSHIIMAMSAQKCF